jgi:fused signal recognition particle receptor
MFNFIKEKLKYIYNNINLKLQSIFSNHQIDEKSIKEIEKIFINSDTGIQTTKFIIKQLENNLKTKGIESGSDLKKELEQILNNILKSNQSDIEKTIDADIFLLVGINGSGKTTFASKLAYMLKKNNQKVLLVAADTFRAAATNQLNEWAKKLSIDIIISDTTKDPAAVVFQGCQAFIKGGYDKMIVDTAGRLQTKINLMKELEKIQKVINNQLNNKKITTLLTIDGMLGQNSFDQAKIFNESTNLSGIVLTKMDGTGKGGIIFAISKELNIPIIFISYGEQVDQLKLFNPKEYINELIN